MKEYPYIGGRLVENGNILYLQITYLVVFRSLPDVPLEIRWLILLLLTLSHGTMSDGKEMNNC